MPSPPRPRPHCVRARALGLCALSGRVLGSLLWVSAFACAPSAQKTLVPGSAEEIWRDAALRTAKADDEAAWLEARAGASELDARLARLDRLLDLFDVARFSGDRELAQVVRAAAGLEGVLGPADATTREVALSLVEEAWQVESQFEKILASDAPQAAQRRAFLADFIMLVSIDAQPALESEDIRVRALAWRLLREQGHARIVDNARIRAYDHIRGLMVLATESDAGRMSEILAQRVIIARDDAELREPAPLITRDQAESLRAELREAWADLVQLPRWQGLAELRRPSDDALVALVEDRLPVRDPSWSVPSVVAPGGATRADRGWPVVVHDGQNPVLWARGDGQPLELAPAPVQLEQTQAAIASALSADGRGTLLLALTPELPGTEISGLLDLAKAAGASELALALAAAPEGGHPRVAMFKTSAPRMFEWAPSDSHVAMNMRVGATVGSGRVRWQIDGRQSSDIELQALPEAALRLRRAYPRETVIGLQVEGSATAADLARAVLALLGGTDDSEQSGLFRAAALHAPELRRGDNPGIEARIAARLQIADAVATRTPRLEQPYPLRGDDQKRLESTVAELSACLPEFGVAGLPARVGLALRFEEGVLVDLEAGRAPEAFTSCVRALAGGLRLREHRDAVALQVQW